MSDWLLVNGVTGQEAKALDQAASTLAGTWESIEAGKTGAVAAIAKASGLAPQRIVEILTEDLRAAAADMDPHPARQHWLELLAVALAAAIVFAAGRPAEPITKPLATRRLAAFQQIAREDVRLPEGVSPQVIGLHTAKPIAEGMPVEAVDLRGKTVLRVTLKTAAPDAARSLPYAARLLLLPPKSAASAENVAQFDVVVLSAQGADVVIGVADSAVAAIAGRVDESALILAQRPE